MTDILYKYDKNDALMGNGSDTEYTEASGIILTCNGYIALSKGIDDEYWMNLGGAVYYNSTPKKRALERFLEKTGYELDASQLGLVRILIIPPDKHYSAFRVLKFYPIEIHERVAFVPHPETGYKTEWFKIDELVDTLLLELSLDREKRAFSPSIPRVICLIHPEYKQRLDILLT